MKAESTNRRTFLKQAAAGVASASALPAFGVREGEGVIVPGGGPSQTPRQDPWQAVRDQFRLEAGYTYMNTAGLGPTPAPVMSAMNEAWRRLETHSETGHGEVAAVRERAANFLGCHADELAFTRNATEGMNLVARGLELNPGDEVLMTTHEHPGGAMPWFGIREGVEIRIRTLDPGSGGDETLARIREAITPRTRVVMVSHILCTTGAILPVGELADLCRRQDIACVLDGAQAPGQIPLDLHDLGCDFYVASGHKWLLGPKETGFLYVRDAWLDRWKPAYVGAYSDDGFDLERGIFNRLRAASSSEYGTRSTPLIRGLHAALEFMDALGMEEVARRGTALAGRLRRGVEGLPGVEILTPSDCCAAILTLRLPASGGRAGDWVNRIRRDHGIRLRPVSEAGLNGVRASTHVFNTEAEVDGLMEVLRALA